MIIKYSSTLLILFLYYILSITSEKIEKCQSERKMKLSRWNNGGFMEGYIDTELDTDTTEDLVFIKKITFTGYVQYDNESQIDLRVKFNSIKAVRIQRILDYKYNNTNEDVQKFCNLGFMESADVRLGIPYVVQQNILQIAQTCIEKVICQFDPNRHKIGDEIHVQSRLAKGYVLKPTTQDTVNAAIDLIVNKLVNGLVAANLSVIYTPEFELSGLGSSFSSKSGIIDIFTHIKRAKDFVFHYEGHRFSVGTTFNLTGGIIQLNDVKLRIGFFPIYTTLSLPVDGISLRMTVSVNYNVLPCIISADQVKLYVPKDALRDFISVQLVRYWLTKALANRIEEVIKSYIHFSCTMGNQILRS